MVDALEEYPWSSYRAYMLNEPDPLLMKEQILSYFPEPREEYYYQFLMQKEIYSSKEMERLFLQGCL
jgi:putative transposase